MEKTSRDIEYLIYLTHLIKNLKSIKTKIEKKRDLEEEDRDVIKATIEAFLKMDKEI